MATPTYTPIASITLGSSASSVTFSSIPQDYRDLVLVVNALRSSAAEMFGVLNADTTGYSFVLMQGDGSSPFSTSGSISSLLLCAAPNQNVLVNCSIMDYSATDKHTTTIGSYDESSTRTGRVANRYADTAAITSIELSNSGGGSFNTGSTFALYGIEA